MKKVLLFILFLSYSVSYAVEDYVWHTPSLDSSESMPLGGGDIGMNVWVDIETNEVKCLFCQSGRFDIYLLFESDSQRPERGVQSRAESLWEPCPVGASACKRRFFTLIAGHGHSSRPGWARDEKGTLDAHCSPGRQGRLGKCTLLSFDGWGQNLQGFQGC